MSRRHAALEQQAITATPRADSPSLGRADAKVTLGVFAQAVDEALAR